MTYISLYATHDIDMTHVCMYMCVYVTRPNLTYNTYTPDNTTKGGEPPLRKGRFHPSAALLCEIR